MTTLDLDALRAEIRSAGHPRGTPDQITQWRTDLEKSGANLTLEGMASTSEDDALYAMMLDDGLSPTLMVEVIPNLYW